MKNTVFQKNYIALFRQRKLFPQLILLVILPRFNLYFVSFNRGKFSCPGIPQKTDLLKK